MKVRVGGGLEFTIHGEPVPKARPRVTSRGAYTPKSTREYEGRVRNAVTLARLRRLVLTPMDSTAWEVTVHLYRYRRAKADVDNFLKSILDGMNGALYTDDSQVERVAVSTRWVETADEARADIFVTPLPYPPRPPRRS